MVRHLNELAAGRGQTLAQLSLAWVLRHPEITSALIGASRPEQIVSALGTLNAPALTIGELEAVEEVLDRLRMAG